MPTRTAARNTAAETRLAAIKARFDGGEGLVLRIVCNQAVRVLTRAEAQQALPNLRARALEGVRIACDVSTREDGVTVVDIGLDPTGVKS
jgi:hypothetical protein